jgi:hypothetical protein
MQSAIVDSRLAVMKGVLVQGRDRKFVCGQREGVRARTREMEGVFVWGKESALALVRALAKMEGVLVRGSEGVRSRAREILRWRVGRGVVHARASVWWGKWERVV